jgi:hypothetical protein
MSYWFRLYTELLNDPKAQRLSGEQFKGWINILCLAKENGGLIPPIGDIAFKLRMSEEDANCLVEELVRRELLDSDGKNMTPHNWHKRQFESDLSTERVKRFRNVSETSPETEADTETEPEQSRAETEASRVKPRSVRAPVLPDDEFLDGLQKNPAYSMLNVRHCYQRMMSWCQVNNKQPSRRRFINWLHREDKPMTANGSPPKNKAAYVGASSEKKPAPMSPEDLVFMDEYIQNLIDAEDFTRLGREYDNIIQRGGAKLEWEIRCVAWYELHRNETTSEVL